MYVHFQSPTKESIFTTTINRLFPLQKEKKTEIEKNKSRHRKKTGKTHHFLYWYATKIFSLCQAKKIIIHKVIPRFYLFFIFSLRKLYLPLCILTIWNEFSFQAPWKISSRSLLSIYVLEELPPCVA